MSSPQRHANQLTSEACRDVDSTMAAATRPSPIVVWDESGPGQSPFQQVIVPVRRSPNARLHSEIGIIESAVSGHLTDPYTYVSAASALVKTCKQLGHKRRSAIWQYLKVRGWYDGRRDGPLHWWPTAWADRGSTSTQPGYRCSRPWPGRWRPSRSKRPCAASPLPASPTQVGNPSGLPLIRPVFRPPVVVVSTSR